MTTTNTPQVHGHDLLSLVGSAAKPFTRQSLTAEAQRLWGPAPRFYTCHSEGLTLDELLEFLLARGKLVEAGGFLATDPSKICSGGHHHH